MRRVRKHRAPKGALRLGLDRAAADDEEVRKHRAPKGALRHVLNCVLGSRLGNVRKHRAPKGALRLTASVRAKARVCQKAPSAKRCIKTHPSPPATHPAHPVRKHRAPKGALRPDALTVGSRSTQGQKAPSNKRCIKTSPFEHGQCCVTVVVRKHRAPKGALRQPNPTVAR